MHYLFLLALLPTFTFAQSPEILAGGGPGTNSDALTSSLSLTQAVALGPGGRLYFTSQSRVYRLEANGKLTVVAGAGPAGFSGDGGPAIDAKLSTPYGIVLDAQGNLYISDYGNHRIRKVTTDGIIQTIAGNGAVGYGGDGNAAVDALMRYPCGLTFDKSGNLYVAESGSHAIRKIAPDGTITTVAGFGYAGFSGDDSNAVDARIQLPTDVAFDSSGNMLIADYGNHRIRKVDTSGKITTIAGTGSSGFLGDGAEATKAQFSSPIALTLDKSNNIYVSDYFNHRIRRISSSGTITTYAGSDKSGFAGDGSAATSAQLFHPRGITIDSDGNLYLADLFNKRIRRIVSSGTISTLAGNGIFQFGGEGGSARNAQMNQPSGAAYDPQGNLFIVDTANHRVRKVNPDGVITTVMGDGTASANQLSYPSAVAIDPSGNVLIADTGNNRIRQIDSSGVVSNLTITPALRGPAGLATDADGNLYIADTGNNVVLRRSKAGEVTTMISASSGLNAPYGLALDTNGNLFVADLYNQRVVKRDRNGILSEAIPPASNTFPVGVLTDAKGNLYVTYYAKHELIKLTPLGEQTRLLGPSDLYFPQGLSLDSSGALIISDTGNNRVLRLPLDK